MEEKKLDINSIIGFALIFGILMYMLWQNQPTPEEIAEQEKAKQEQLATEEKAKPQNDVIQTKAEDFSVTSASDSTQLSILKNKLGAFAYSSTLPSAKEDNTVVETPLFYLKFSNKGGFLSEVRLKNFVNYDSIPIHLIKDKNTAFNINFGTTDSRILNTQDLYFQPSVSNSGDNVIVSMKLKVSESKFLEYRYEIKKDDYMMDFTIRSQGLDNVINSSQEINLDWQIKTYRHAKSVSYENRYTELVYEYEGGKDDYLGQSELSEDTADDVTYVAFKQHFFTSILLADTPFRKADLKSSNLIKDEEIDTVYTKAFAVKLPLELTAGEINKTMDLYFGPSDYKILNAYDRNLDEVVPLGWGIFGWINRYVFIPTFGFLSSFLPYGFAIILMTILVRIVMSPVTYKSYVSQAKMKVLKPEIAEINEKYKDNAMKKQQALMALYKEAGASPLAGCVPMLIQFPILIAIFRLFPSAIEIRQKAFLWADDLSSFDYILDLPFTIPQYGDHVSLFTILMAIALIFSSKLNTGQMNDANQQMPGMKFMMTYMMPVMLLFIFNSYSSGLSYYYFLSNVITLGQTLFIRRFVDDEALLRKLHENKKKPVKKSKWQERLEAAAKQKGYKPPKKK